MTDTADTPPPATAPTPSQMAKTLAVQEAIFEVISEQRVEIIRRAKEKLLAQGVELSDADIGMPL